MKLVRYGKLGEEKPGIVDSHGIIRDISHILDDINPRTLSNLELLYHLNLLDVETLPAVDKDARLGACVGTPGKLICIGFNSHLHTTQMGLTPMPENEILVFMKPSCAICGPQDPILYTRHTKKLDWEAELGIVIGKKGKYITPEQAKDHIFGYTCINDLSERYWQLETMDKQFTKGKCFDNAAPMGPYLVTRDEIADSSNLDIKLWVNGELRQEFNTSDYIHNDIEVISYVSQYFTLYPGDVISMGSAPGNAKSWGDDKYLKPNDKVVFTIIGLGQQEQVVVVEEEFFD